VKLWKFAGSLFILPWILAGGASQAKAAWADREKSGPTLLRDIPYPGAVMGERRRSLDLYLPADSGRRPPLLIFVHGGFWLLPDDQYGIGPAVAETLTRDGIAVAALRYRLAPGYPHPTQAEDVAAGVALLIKEAKRYGYDEKRIFLAGHSAGGHLASLVALDPSYLGKHRVNAKSLAGIVSFSGLYDLLPRRGISDNQRAATEKTFGHDRAVLEKASPLAHARADAPPFLLFTAQTDFPGFVRDAKQFHDALRKAGHRRVERWIVAEHDHFSVLQLGERDNEARLLLLEFLKVAPLPPEFAILVEAKRRWRSPPFSTQSFWRRRELVRSYRVDQRFLNQLIPLYSTLSYELQEWPMEKFHAIDLFAFLESLPPDKRGRGDYLVTTNVRNEKQYWHRREIAAYQPVIVIGLDDEKDLFRLGIFYRANREYSWKEGPRPPLMARPLGAFIYFLKKPPQDLPIHASQYGLTENSFKLVTSDPLSPIKDLQKDVYETITVRNGCVYCHSLRGVGPQSHHVTAATAAKHGGMALPLESYPPEVWKDFIFNQESVAKKIGATPNTVAEPIRRPLFDLINQARDAPAKPVRQK
jgi:acetyl esterase/lipase